MKNTQFKIAQISASLQPHGLIARGGFFDDSRSIVLVGSAGSAFWPAFKASPEYSDGRENPLDRWSERIGNDIAAMFGAECVFPFGEAPYHPFLRWSQRAEPVLPSALGILIHPEFGLWHAYRFALLLPAPLAVDSDIVAAERACDSCAGKPCLSACPVGAFSTDGYDVEVCYRYLAANPDSDCNTAGCLARRSCPEAAELRYADEHAAFHMSAFVRSQGKIFGDG